MNNSRRRFRNYKIPGKVKALNGNRWFKPILVVFSLLFLFSLVYVMPNFSFANQNEDIQSVSSSAQTTEGKTDNLGVVSEKTDNISVDYNDNISSSDSSSKNETEIVSEDKNVSDYDSSFANSQCEIKGDVVDHYGYRVFAQIDFISNGEVVSTAFTKYDSTFTMNVDINTVGYIYAHSDTEEYTSPEITVTEDMYQFIQLSIMKCNVTGTILDIDNNPVENATVDFTNNAGYVFKSTTTDANGKYLFEFDINTKGNIHAYTDTLEGSVNDITVRKDMEPIDIQITTIQCWLDGKVYYDQYKKLPGANVDFVKVDGTVVSTKSFIDASYSFKLDINTKGYVHAYFGDYEGFSDEVVVTKNMDPVDIQTEIIKCQVKGIVYDGKGLPMANGNVSFISEGTCVQTGHTDDQGNFNILVDIGTTGYIIAYNDLYRGESEEVYVDEGMDEIIVHTSKIRCDVLGTIRDQYGEVVPYANVVVKNGDEEISERVQANDSGQYIITLDRYTDGYVYAWADNFEGRSYNFTLDQSIMVNIDGHKVNCEIQLKLLPGCENMGEIVPDISEVKIPYGSTFTVNRNVLTINMPDTNESKIFKVNAFDGFKFDNWVNVDGEVYKDDEVYTVNDDVLVNAKLSKADQPVPPTPPTPDTPAAGNNNNDNYANAQTGDSNIFAVLGVSVIAIVCSVIALRSAKKFRK